MADVDHPAKVILITSSIPTKEIHFGAKPRFFGEKAGQKVLLVDGDLRHPSITKYWGMEDRGGLVDLLTGTASFEDIVIREGGLTVSPPERNRKIPPTFWDPAHEAHRRKVALNV